MMNRWFNRLVKFGVSTILLIYVANIIFISVQSSFNNPNNLNTTINSDVSQAINSVANIKYYLYFAIILFNFLLTCLPLAPENELNDEEIENKVIPHKQTYLEYVQERLAVERMMK